MKRKYQWLFFATFILFLLSCKSSKSALKSELINSNCIDKKALEFLAEDYIIKKAEIKEIEIISYLAIDSLCNGLYIIDYKFKDKTGFSVPLIKSGGKIIKYKSNDREANILSLELFRQKLNGIMALSDYEKIEKRFLIGALAEFTIY
jgi:hypothetical protein